MSKNLSYSLLLLIGFVFATHAHAQLPAGIALLPNDTALFKTPAFVQLVSTTSQPFAKAYHISTLNPTGKDNFTLRCNLDAVVKTGDVLSLSFYTRSLQSKKETGESFMEISLDRTIGGKYNWPPLFERGMSFGTGWSLVQIPFVAARDVEKGELSLVIKCGSFPQVFELGGFSLVNYQHKATIAQLPRTTVHYDGDSPDAPWRKAAAERIEKYRKGDLTVKVVDKNGKPVTGATVAVTMKKIAYGWGTATNSKLILDSTNPSYKKYRDTLLKYFNKVVFENEMKSKNWAKTDHNKTILANNWLRQHNIPARGHVMVWPSWQNSGHLIHYKNDTAALRAAIIKDIVQETDVMKGQFTEWDVVNEPYAHDAFLKLLGKDVMVDWFKAARERTSGVQLFLNDYTMFHGLNVGSESFYNIIKFLKDKGAEIDAIGEQSHIGGTPPVIDYVLERLDHFGSLGLPIQISEFDISSDDDDFKARYIKDFFTAIFSHPSTIGIMQWGFWEPEHWIPASALWDKDWNIRPEGKAFTELVSKTWATNTAGQTNKDGTYTIRGFNGEYEVVVNKKGGKQVASKAVLTSNGQTVVVKLLN
ncbi:endo-1,4-beta-xylanase [Parasediminibacterium sp. JCM 36343]|uniref:endo-1,4-beta-xylanase n=1 Tax=Parasediminibacterium sp. JCM 36343 TaxID=3374279 RepID=UPI00397B24C8